MGQCSIILVFLSNNNCYICILNFILTLDWDSNLLYLSLYGFKISSFVKSQEVPFLNFFWGLGLARTSDVPHTL